MKKNILSGIVLVFIFVFWVVGCKQTPSGPTGTSNGYQQSLDDAVSSEPLLTGDAATLEDGSSTSNPDPSLSKTSAAIGSILGWGRHMNSSARTVSYTQIDDTTMAAAITNTLIGELWIVENNHNQNPTIIVKPDTINTIRNAKFVKVVKNDSTLWKLRYLSAVQGTTTSPVDAITITDVTFFIGADTIDITPPPYNDYLQLGVLGRHGLHVMQRDLLRKFTVEATVVSTAPDSDIVVVHHPNDAVVRIRERMVLVSSTDNGNGTFIRVYRRSWIGDFPGHHTVFVTALTRKSIYDDQTPVTSQGWGIPYIVN
jgi:hypothetical protein